LEELPADLNETYTNMIAQIPSYNHTLAKDALQWLCYARRPLKLAELCEAVVYSEGEKSIGQESRLQPAEILLRICQGFVTLESTSNTVALAHASIRDFLTSKDVIFGDVNFRLENANASRTIISKCISYLMMDCFADGFSDNENHRELAEAFPLLEYAALWPSFVDNPQSIESLNDNMELEQVLEFFSTHELERGGNFSCWVGCLYPDTDSDIIRTTKPLYCAAVLGMVGLVSMLLQSDMGGHIDALGGRHRCTALCVASYYGHTEVVRVLLEKGANPNTTDKEGFSCLFWARSRGHQECDDLLRKYGAHELVPEPVMEVQGKSVTSFSSACASADPNTITCVNCSRILSRYNTNGRCLVCGYEWDKWSYSVDDDDDDEWGGLWGC
jgi:hypothetical protein